MRPFWDHLCHVGFLKQTVLEAFREMFYRRDDKRNEQNSLDEMRKDKHIQIFLKEMNEAIVKDSKETQVKEAIIKPEKDMEKEKPWIKLKEECLLPIYGPLKEGQSLADMKYLILDQKTNEVCDEYDM